MQIPFSERFVYITRRIHPLAVRFQTGESGIDQAIRQESAYWLMAKSRIRRPIASTLRSEVSPASRGS